MKLAVISFTRTGATLCGRLVKGFRDRGEDCNGYIQKRFLNEFQEVPGLCAVEEPLAEWTGRQFEMADGLIFIGAAGIAVRAIASHLRDKYQDPAVVVVDERGRFAISLLSGHVGGANALAGTIADLIGAAPVVTTASDVNGREAIDVWAARRGLAIADRELAKQVAAAMLEDQPVGFYSDYPLQGPLPEGCVQGQLCEWNVWLTARTKAGPDDMVSWFASDPAKILRLAPPVLAVGVGCRRGISEPALSEALTKVLDETGLEARSVACLASIDRKAREPGLLELADVWKLPFKTWPAEALEAAAGTFEESEFVRSVTGVGNVCERAALLAAGENGRMLVQKQICGGITLAIAAGNYTVKLPAAQTERG